MSYRAGWSDALIGDDVDLFTFRFVWVLGPLLISSFIPTLLFGVLLGQWGSNLIWGSVYGMGWCLAAFATGGVGGKAVLIGLAWAWSLPVLFYFASGWLWYRLKPRTRRRTIVALMLSFLLVVPARFFELSEQVGVHIPDFGWHMVNVY